MRFIAIILIGVISLSWAWTGNASASFLKLSVDARACGMGEGVSAYSNNISAIYYNPAGLGEIGKFDMMFMHNQWLMSMYHEYFAIGYAPEKIGGFGLSFNYWGSGSIQGFDERGDTIRVNGTPYTFSSSDWALTLGYGKALDKLSLGAAFKFVSEKNESLAASGAGFDFGMRLKLPVKGVTIATSVSNLGTRLKLDQLAFPLPVLWRIGIAYRTKSLGFASDLIVSNSDNISAGLGFEYWLAEILALRMGYRSGSNVDGFSGLRAGLGIKHKGFGIDYAFAPYGSLGMSHRVTVSFGLEPIVKPSRIRKPAKPTGKK